MRVFQKTKELELQADQFLDAVSEGTLVFKKGVSHYLDGNLDGLAECLREVDELEGRADELRRQIESRLYVHSLIPDQRGDVLGLLESTDDVIDTANETLAHFDVEKPEIPPELHESFRELTEQSAAAAEALVLAARAFFRDVNAVKDHLHKVYFYEGEADKVSLDLRRRIFALDTQLSHQLHLRQFVKIIEDVSDRAEAVADRITIYAIKRRV